MKAAIRIAICLLLLFLAVDVVKGILPGTCSRPGHYHATHYGSTSGHSSGAKWQSGRSVMSYSGGKDDCALLPFSGFGIAVNLYGFAIAAASMLLGLPAMACEMLVGSAAICLPVRLLNGLFMAAYLLAAVAHYALTGKLVLDLSDDELSVLKKALTRK